MDACIPLESARDSRGYTFARRSRVVSIPAMALAAGLLVAGCASQKQATPEPPTSVTRLPVDNPPINPVPDSRPSVPSSPTCGKTITLDNLDGRPPHRDGGIRPRGRGRPWYWGAFHGNEPTGADVARQLIRYLGSNPQVYTGRRLAVIAVVNPDGLARGTRENADGVDLNRNFPARNFLLPSPLATLRAGPTRSASGRRWPSSPPSA